MTDSTPDVAPPCPQPELAPHEWALCEHPGQALSYRFTTIPFVDAERAEYYVDLPLLTPLTPQSLGLVLVLAK